MYLLQHQVIYSSIFNLHPSAECPKCQRHCFHYRRTVNTQDWVPNPEYPTTEPLRARLFDNLHLPAEDYTTITEALRAERESTANANRKCEYGPTSVLEVAFVRAMERAIGNLVWTYVN